MITKKDGKGIDNLNDARAFLTELQVKDQPKPEEVPTKSLMPKGKPVAQIQGLDWKREDIQPKTAETACIVIDRWDRWHENAKVDLFGMDTSTFRWGYYGTNYPVLVEDDEGVLHPFYLDDRAGESSSRLYKAANPEGFRNSFKHRGNTLQKIQIGLMVALVLGIFFLMYVMIS